MELRYIDIHSHVNLKPLREIEGEVVLRMQEKQVGTITVGVDFETSKESIALAEKYPETVLGATIGLHPTDNVKEAFDFEKYKTLAENERVVAVGECGLDYFRDTDDEIIAKQKNVFREHIKLAQAVGKPLMIHARPGKGSMNAYLDAITILKEYEGLSGNFHFFVGDTEIAKQILDLGFTMSFDGPITFTHEYNEVIRYIPLSMLHGETDAPFAAPAPYRGKTCEPWMVEEVVRRIAKIRDEDLEKVGEAFLMNAQRVFKLSWGD